MNTTITSDQIEEFQTQGFLVIEGFLDNEELNSWRQATEEAVSQRLSMTPSQQREMESRYGLSGQKLQNQDNPDTFYSQVFTQCLRLADTHAGIASLVKDARLGQVAATLAGVDGVRMWHDQALVKQPYSNPTAWHLDCPHWAFYTRRSVSMWFPLDDATLANGCLWYLPGSQDKASYELVRIGENMRDLFKSYPEWLEIEAIPAPCPAGSVVIHNGMIAHAAGPNMTPHPRRVMTAVYFPDGEVYNGKPDTLPVAYYSTLTEGDVLDDDRFLPLIWSRTMA